MIQLIVEGNFLDLYDRTPPKLTFQIEDITDTSATSIFSRQFRLPATQRNFQFFKTAFLVNGQDFDVTQKYNASILVDGVEFRRGQFRLNKVYVNEVQSIVDYEAIFLGESKSFASQLGEGFLNEIDLTEYNHVPTMELIVDSWQAYPEGGLTDGLFEGDILYPLIDFGNTYADEGNPPVLTPQETRISAVDASDHLNFTKKQHPVDSSRFKPMVRMKVIFDKCFAETDYTYTSQFMESERVRHMYVSAWGNVPSPYADNSNSNLISSSTIGAQFSAEDEFVVPFQANLDPAGNFDNTTSTYLVPITGTYDLVLNISGQAIGDAPAGGEIEVGFYKNGVALQTNTFVAGAGSLIPWDAYIELDNEPLVAGDEITVQVRITAGQIQSYIVENGASWDIPQAPGELNVALMLNDKYKKIDFIKDTLTRFRLVMQPDPNNQSQFIIEPWQNWIGTGQIYDWTKKVDLSRDIQISPLFYTQAEAIQFSDQAGTDFLNDLNLDEFDEVFGTLLVDSNNELLTGLREIKLIGQASTPITQIEGSTDTYGPSFIIPQIHVHETGNSLDYPLQHIPIKAKTRLLFYNGLKSTGGVEWWDTITAPLNTPRTEYPMVSYYEFWPTLSGGLNLNWQRETGYIRYYSNEDRLRGRSQYEVYWGEYIDSLYDRFARRVTLYVKLSNLDLQDFSFDDVVFIRDTYYYVEKIYDAPVGQDELVKVDLIKLSRIVEIKNQVPPPPEFFWNTINENFNEVEEDWNEK